MNHFKFIGCPWSAIALFGYIPNVGKGANLVLHKYVLFCWESRTRTYKWRFPLAFFLLNLILYRLNFLHYRCLYQFGHLPICFYLSAYLEKRLSNPPPYSLFGQTTYFDNAKVLNKFIPCKCF